MAKLSKDNYIKLGKAISLLESISKDITITDDMEDVIANASDVISSLSSQFSYERSKPFVLEEKHLNYLDSVREELIKAENVKTGGCIFRFVLATDKKTKYGG